MLNILKGNIQSSERKKTGKRAFSGIFIVVVLLVISVSAIVYIAIPTASLKEQIDLKKHNIEFFDNLEKSKYQH
jgi:competence protein ComGC